MSKINVNVDFQNRAIDKLKKRIKFALDSEGDIGEFNFKSCVASGKTVMCARLMQDLVGDDDYKDFAFLWISTSQGNLCYQSKDTISGIVSFECNTFEEALAIGEISPKTCTFIPWEQINKENNKFRGKAEFTTFDKLIADTNCPIILFVDEAHDTFGTDNSEEIVSMISPKLCIKVSATPKEFNGSIDVEVKIEDVIDAGFIKKVVELQKDLIKKDDDSIENILLSAAKKRDELEESYREHGIRYTPLCLIQIANDSTKDDEDDEATKKNKDEIIAILKDNGVLTSDIGIWLSGEKTENIANIKNNNVKFLIIKQALAKGWDCPRSHILVRLRETKSVILDIQTMGRILRTIDKFVGHYGDELIDSAYIYTNDPNFKLSENNYIPTRLNSHRVDIKTEFQDIAGKISIPASHFAKKPPVIKGNNLIKALKSKISDFFIAQNNTIIAEKISRIQLDENTVAVKDTIWSNEEGIADLETKRVPLSAVEIEQKFERIIKKIYSPFSQMILDALDDIAETNNVALSDFYKYVISNEDSYVREIKAAIESIRENDVSNYQYTIPASVTLGKATTSATRYLYTASPIENKKSSSKSPEEIMATYLDNNDRVLFWYKNIERQPDAFCIAYDNRCGTEKNDNFYPDFIVLDCDYCLWILETKGGDNADIDRKTPEKYIGIQHYLKAYQSEILSNGMISSVKFSIVRPVGETLKIFVGEHYKKDLSHSEWVDLNI